MQIRNNYKESMCGEICDTIMKMQEIKKFFCRGAMMEREVILRKKECLSEEFEGEIVVKVKNQQLVRLNSIASYLWKNCDGKTKQILIENLYEDCVNKDEIDKKKMEMECVEAINTLKKYGLVEEE